MQLSPIAALGDLFDDLAPTVHSEPGYSRDHGGAYWTPIRTERIEVDAAVRVSLNLAYTADGWYYGFFLMALPCAWEVLPGCRRRGPFHCPATLGPFVSAPVALSSAARELRHALGQMREQCPASRQAAVDALDARLEAMTRAQAAAI